MNSDKLSMSAETQALAPVIAPLTDREKKDAIEAVKAALSADLSEKYRVMGTELRIQKPDRQNLPARLIGVYVVDYLKSRSIEALVHPRGDVVALNDLPPYQIPISADEVREAQAVASQDKRVAEVLGRHRAVVISPCSPSLPTGKDRIICLQYFHSDSPRVSSARPIGIVEVNLGTNTVKFNAIELEDK